MKQVTQADGPTIQETGRALKKKPNPVYMVPIEEECEVLTNEGALAGHVGDFIAYDPISGHVWPVAASYVEVHYEPAE